MYAVTLAEIESFDPQPSRQGGRTRYLCSLSGMCRDKPRDNAHRSLAVDENTGVFFCHRCGEKGRLREFWETSVSTANKGVRRVSNVRARNVVRPISVAVEKKTDVSMLRDRMKTFVRDFDGSAAQEYLKRRGIPSRVSRTAGCGAAKAWEHWEKQNDEWKLAGTDSRVVFPVTDDQGNLIAFHGRSISDEHFNSAKITKGNKSLGVFLSSRNVFDSTVVAICEGPVDALALESCGVPSVAMIGTTAPKWLTERLEGKAVLIATDADKAGDEAALKLEIALRRKAQMLLRLRPVFKKDWAEEVEMLSLKKTREFLRPFAPDTDDVTRANASWQLAMDDLYENAEFVARLIEDVELRNAFLVLIRKEQYNVAAA